MEEEVVASGGDQQTGYKDSCKPEIEAGLAPGYQSPDLVIGLWVGQKLVCLEKGSAMLDMMDLHLPYDPA